MVAGQSKRETTRLFPSQPLGKESSVSLSILDATVARFSPTSAIWVYDSVPDGIQTEDFVRHLQTCFVETLDSFPQWAGQL